MVLRGCRDLNLELDFGRLLSGLSKKPGATLRLRVRLFILNIEGKRRQIPQICTLSGWDPLDVIVNRNHHLVNIELILYPTSETLLVFNLISHLFGGKSFYSEMCGFNYTTEFKT